MRFIDLNRLTVDASWDKEASDISSEILKDRANIIKVKEKIDKNSSLWGDQRVKAPMLELSHNKCWYSETLIVGSDSDVDHYRPKKRVSGLKNHDGYWWLAFKRDNYRLSCIYSNRSRKDHSTGVVGGKADFFDISVEADRASRPEDDINDESPLLLDPCIRRDVTLINYMENGEVIPSKSSSESPDDHARAKYSIGVYNLNHTVFIDARFKLWNKAKLLIRRYEISYKRYTRGIRSAKSDLDNLADQIRQYYDETEPFSSFMRSMIDSFCADKPYRRDLVGAP